jgi:GNAT superfamily N-acetyltransferase
MPKLSQSDTDVLIGSAWDHGKMHQDLIQIRPLTDSDRPGVARFMEAEWGGPITVVHASVFRPADLPGFIAGRPGGPLAGLLTYVVHRGEADAGGGTLEIVTLNAVHRQAGVGTALIDHAVAEARRLGCHQIRLTTTNDNLDALRFYQRRGFRLAELRPGAVAESRKVKPEIPETGDHGIPVHDELDLVRPI